MSGDRLLREMDPDSDAYKLRLDKVWAEIKAKTEAVEAKRAQAGAGAVQPPEEAKIEPSLGGWMAEYEAGQDELEEALRTAFDRLSKKPPKPESNDTA